MMWLMMVGIVVLMAAAMGVLSSAVARLFAKKRERWLGANEEKNLLRFLTANALLAATHPSPGTAVRDAFFFQELRLRSWRANLLWSCWASFALWLPLAVALSPYRISGLWMIALAGLLLAASSFVRPGRGLAVLVLAWGAFLFLLESGTRAGAGLMRGGEGTELISFLADGRPVAVLSLFVSALLLAAAFRIRFFFFSVAVLLLTAGWMSLSGAVLLWFGERVGLSLGTWLRARKARTGPRRLASLSMVAGLAGGVVGLLVVGFARDGLTAVPAFGEAGPFESLQAFALLSVLAEIPILVLASARGHFEAKAPPDDLFQKSASEPDLEALEPGLLRPALLGLEHRLRNLRAVRGELGAEDWSKIPPGLRAASEEENRELERRVSEIRAHLLSRSSGFPDPLR